MDIDAFCGAYAFALLWTFHSQLPSNFKHHCTRLVFDLHQLKPDFSGCTGSSLTARASLFKLDAALATTCSSFAVPEALDVMMMQCAWLTSTRKRRSRKKLCCCHHSTGDSTCFVLYNEALQCTAAALLASGDKQHPASRLCTAQTLIADRLMFCCSVAG